jgi:hypothetical protein
MFDRSVGILQTRCAIAADSQQPVGQSCSPATFPFQPFPDRFRHRRRHTLSGQLRKLPHKTMRFLVLYVQGQFFYLSTVILNYSTITSALFERNQKIMALLGAGCTQEIDDLLVSPFANRLFRGAVPPG